MDWIFLFVVTVWKMRQAQITYFRNRTHGDLVEAKRYENMLDAELKKRLVFTNGVPTGLSTGEEVPAADEPKQTGLFE